MARSLQVLLCKVIALTRIQTVSANSCRFASGGSSKSWRGQYYTRRDKQSYMDEKFDDDFELDDAEDGIQAMLDEEMERQRRVKFHMVRRQMTPKGAPQRKLTWDAIQQIRYLKENQPEEWTVERLAEGYCVTPDVILRVLRSKFVPSPARKSKQDAKVMAELGQQTLTSGAGTQKDRQNLLGVVHTQALLPSGGSGSALVSMVKNTELIQGEGSESSVQSLVPVRIGVSVAPFTADSSENDTLKNTTEDNPTTDEDEDEDDEEFWDGQVLTEEELEQFMEMKPSPVVKAGSEFYDAEGNLLYRI